MAAELAEAERLLEAARDHKRAARQHRERAKALMEQLNELIAAAAERGIQIQINHHRAGRHSGSQHPHPTRS